MCRDACDFDPSKPTLVLTNPIQKIHPHRSIRGDHLLALLTTAVPGYR